MMQETKFLLKNKIALFISWLGIPLFIGVLAAILFPFFKPQEHFLFTVELSALFSLFATFLCYNVHSGYQNIFCSFETSLLFGKTRRQYVVCDLLSDMILTTLFAGIFFTYFSLLTRDMLKIWPYISANTDHLASQILPFPRILLYCYMVSFTICFIWRMIYQFSWKSIFIVLFIGGISFLFSYFKITIFPLKIRYILFSLSCIGYLISCLTLLQKDLPTNP